MGRNRCVVWLAVAGWLVGCGSEGMTTPSGMVPMGGGDAGMPMDMVPMEMDPPEPTGLPLLGAGSHSAENVTVTVLLDADDGLVAPRDLAFNPEVAGELWVVSQSNHAMIIAEQDGDQMGNARRMAGPGNRHFLAKPAALAFGAPGTAATAQMEHEVTQPTTPADFMGPTLWSTERGVFDGGHAGHLDMLHNSPDGAGIAWDTGNAYFIFDGYHESITRYDFQHDHGPGGADHSDGIVHRYVEGEVSFVPGVPAHMEMDHESGLLYIADTGNNRVAVLDPSVGMPGGDIFPNYDGSVQKHWVGGQITTLVEGAEVGLTTPSGLALHDGHIFVSDHDTNVLAAFDMEGMLVDYVQLPGMEAGSLAGIAFDDEGRLYVVDGRGDRVLRIEPAAQ